MYVARHTDHHRLQNTQLSASLPDELNHFYARFDRGNKEFTLKVDLLPGELRLTLSTSDVCSALCKVNARKAAGPEVFTDITNLSLTQAAIPTSFMTATIVPVPKHSTASALNDFRPVALNPIIAKCLERLVLSNRRSRLPATLNPHQFGYRCTRSTEDAFFKSGCCSLTSVHQFINTVTPSKADLQAQLTWYQNIPLKLDFLTNRPQFVKLDNFSSSTITLNSCVPQGCMLSLLLYSLLSHLCARIQVDILPLYH